MEILTNIWNVLTTENVMLTKFMGFPFVIIEDWIAFLLISLILKINYTKKQKIIYIAFLSTISLITTFIIPSPYNVIVNYLVMFLFVHQLLEVS